MKIYSIIFTMISFLGLTACAAATPPVTQPTSQAAVNVPAAQPTATWTPAPTWTPTPSPQPTPTNTRVPTVTPSATPTPTPEPRLMAQDTLQSSINVRSGPDTDYPVIGEMKPGEITLVTGRNPDNSWWQVNLTNTQTSTQGWVYGELAAFSGNRESVPVVEAPPLPPTTAPTPAAAPGKAGNQPLTPEELADKLRCGKDFCVTYQALVPIWENGGCIGNHSIYITVLQGLPPGQPLDGVVVGDTYNNVEVASGDHGPGHTEITLWSNSMTLIVKRNIDGTPYTSQESFNFTAQDELIPAEVLASAGYCEGNVEKCEFSRNHNQVCRGHYSWRVTFHKFD